MVLGDFLEMGPSAEDDMTYTVWVYGDAGRIVGVFNGVTGPAVRYHGSWAIEYTHSTLGEMTAYIPADAVAYMAYREVPDTSLDRLGAVRDDEDRDEYA